MRALLLLLACVPTAALAGQVEAAVEAPVAYVDAYRTIARQFEACYRARGIWGNGFDVLADLDTTEQVGRVELFKIGMSGSKPSKVARVVTITPAGEGARVQIAGHSEKYVHITASAISGWLGGSRSCSGRS